ncbi:MAG: methyltransferase [Bacteroidales bacterium]|nr:methyltransferase [Bacteroidales bacterium]
MFRFRQFSIEDDRSTMKVGTDGVLLGALALCHGTRILDLGTGSGLIALMLAQRYQKATIDAIDVDEASVLQARENFQRSPWGDRLTAIVADARLYKPACSYDLVVSNPPFFAQSLKSPEARRTLARHNDTLSTAELLQCVSRLLAEEGRFWCVLPVEGAEKMREMGEDVGLKVSRRVAVSDREGQKPKRVYFEMVKTEVAEWVAEVHYLKEADGSRSEWYGKTTGGFYL